MQGPEKILKDLCSDLKDPQGSLQGPEGSSRIFTGT